jgi:hypothetical protein
MFVIRLIHYPRNRLGFKNPYKVIRVSLKLCYDSCINTGSFL